MISDLLTTVYPTPPRGNRETRLKMKPGTAARGDIDGGWWPWSTDPALEFPALVLALSSWIGPISHLACHSEDWDAAGPILTVEGWTVHVDAGPAVQPNTVVLTGPNLKQVRVLVVPPGTPGRPARAALRSSSSSDTATAAEILARNGVSPARPTSTAGTA
jgi:Family of unknown function (DUF5994)